MRAFSLLFGSWLIDLPGTLTRVLLFMGLAGFTGNGWIVAAAVLVALYPTWGPLLALAFPTGHLLTRAQVGAREPSDRERRAVAEALAVLNMQGQPAPRRWYVMDNPTINGFVVGDALYLNRGTITTPEALAPILAHELGHLNTHDGRYTLATRRMTFPPLLYLADLTRYTADVANTHQLTTGRKLGCGFFGYLVWSWIMFFLAGGLGLKLLRPLWFTYWRDREYAADAYAAGLGQGPQLAEVLEVVALPLDSATPFMSFVYDRQHPYTELRIDRLEQVNAADELPAMPLAPRPWLWGGLAGAPLALLVLLVLAPVLLYTSPTQAEELGPNDKPGALFTPIQTTETAPTATPRPTREAARAEATATPNQDATIQAMIQATGQARGVIPTITPTVDAVQATVEAAIQGTAQALASPTPASSPAQAGGQLAPLAPRRVSASRTAPSGQDAAGRPVTYEAANVTDGDPATAWRAAGSAEGDRITLEYERPVTVLALDIVNGYAKSDPATGADRYAENRRVLRVRVEYDGGSYEADLRDGERAAQRVSLPQAVQTGRLAVVILAASSDGGRDFTAISEITALGSASQGQAAQPQAPAQEGYSYAFP